MARLAGKVAIVTGSGQGIGAVMAKALAYEGAAVMVSDRFDPFDTVKSITTSGGAAVGFECDVTVPIQVNAMVEATLDNFGRLDILVANAGLFSGLARQSFMDIDEADWDRVMLVNTRGVFSCVKAVFPTMQRQGCGSIVTIASTTVFKGTTQLLHYVASKGAVVALTRALAREIGNQGVRVNGIAPGLTMSENIIEQEQWSDANRANVATRALRRDQTPADLVGALLFLCSSDSDFVTGQTLVVDGGSVMR